ncbi:MAG: flagellar brake protein [Bdellovibrio sp.]
MAMNSHGQSIFKKVGISEKKMLFRQITEEKVQLTVKGTATDNLFHLIAVQNEKDEVLLCHHTADSKEIKESQSAVINFSFKNERYFFQTELYFESGWIVLKLDTELFNLQRRANARVDLPEAYNGVFFLNQHLDKSYFIDCKIKDISAGGLKIELPSDAPKLKIDDNLKGSLRLGNRRAMEMEVKVRFVQKSELNGKEIQIAGVQFLNVDQTLENRLLSLMMDLQRELYLKFSKK